MRLNNFESSELTSLGEGKEKKVFINPEDEGRIISEKKEGVEKETPRQLKGRYYLQKIVHVLLPDNTPDIYQVSESTEGEQVIDAERISHTSGHELLQEKRRLGEDEEPAKQKIIEELGGGMNEVTNALADIGLAFNIDENVGNYTKDEEGNVHYLETFKPWEVDVTDSTKLEMLFDKEELFDAINNITDSKIKEQSLKYFARLLTLFEEEENEMREMQNSKEDAIECGPYITDIELIMNPFMTKESLASLRSLKTQEEAVVSQERKLANKALGSIMKKLNYLQDETNIADEQHDDLYKKYRILFNAVGMINRGMVDHDR